MIHLRLKALSKKFQVNKQSKFAFENIDAEVHHGEFVAIVGPSGCGKTTLLRVIAGLEQASSGEIHIENNRSHNTAMVFQEHGLFPWMSLKQNIEIVLKNNPNIAASEVSKISAHFLQITGLSGFADYLPHQVSGGMRQRVNVARAFANKPGLLLMDEPFVFLDYQTRLSLHELLMSIWNEYKHTVLFVTHDIEEAVLLADRVLLMTACPGRIAESFEVQLERPRDMLKARLNPAFYEPVNEILQFIQQQPSSGVS